MKKLFKIVIILMIIGIIHPSVSAIVSPASSDDATLIGLTLSKGSLTPMFDSYELYYTVFVSNSVSSVTATATATQLNSTITVNGIATVNGQASSPIALNEGNTSIVVRVTAPNGSATRTYSITVNRASLPPLSDDATLIGLTLSKGSLTPMFDSYELYYTVFVSNSVSSVTATATATQLNSTITVNGIATVNGQASSPIALNEGNTSIVVRVTAPNGSATRTYSITVNRDLTTGIEENKDEKLYFYPNPALAHANINFPANGKGKIKVSIYNFSGKLLLDKETDNVLSLEYLMPGQYVIKYEQGSVHYTGILIII
jgi:hypothetical protein